MKIEFDKVIKSDLNPLKDGLTMGESIIAINEFTNGMLLFLLMLANIKWLHVDMRILLNQRVTLPQVD
jgi:hypothetical protein